MSQFVTLHDSVNNHPVAFNIDLIAKVVPKLNEKDKATLIYLSNGDLTSVTGSHAEVVRKLNDG